jgi:hypothetical protein
MQQGADHFREARIACANIQTSISPWISGNIAPHVFS